LKIKHLQDELKEKNAQLKELSGTDDLTKLYNRRRFMEQFTSEFFRAQRYNHPLAFVILDIDYFKSVNDKHGHLAGDAALVEIAAVMRRNMRKSDILARYGGEEFTLLLPETGLKGAHPYAERMRHQVESASFLVTPGKDPLKLTVSGGVACFPDLKVASVDELLRKADEALYRAKNSGRNRIEIAE
jgi:diguanylate cyclase (GGDEF)-like protein